MVLVHNGCFVIYANTVLMQEGSEVLFPQSFRSLDIYLRLINMHQMSKTSWDIHILVTFDLTMTYQKLSLWYFNV